MEDATEGDRESVVGDEAHIVAQSGKGPRAGLIPDGEVDRYENLILLCKVHHKLIDDQPAAYTVERLREMKRAHEQWAEQKIRELDRSVDIDDVPPEVFDHVPKTTEELNYVVGKRPYSWEYLMYAGLLQVGLLDAKRRVEDHRPLPLEFRDKQAALRHVSVLLDELTAIVQRVMDCFDPLLLSKALGEPGRPGEFRLIGDVAHRLVAAYAEFAAWSASVRNSVVPRQARRAFAALVHMADRPMQDVETYVQRLVAQLNGAMERVSQGSTEPVVLTIICEITADRNVADEVTREVRRAYRRW
ncbi:HNH endonuclease signature motif containing protein [Streptomyces sp. CG1]|uniref:HNH endonuclease signature motif containing protein n=1 Tax=Streptomyces sp. CG1 TaxID=1287523 RepID=UPI0034E28195